MKAHKHDIGHLLLQHNYKFLGWMNGWSLNKPPQEYINCHALNHKTDGIQVNQRGTENIVSCDVCKIYWKYDSSD